MPTIEYGNIKVDLKWKWPTKDTFDNWKQDFFKLEECKDYDFYLVGRFNDVLLENKKNNTSDIDIIIIGPKNIQKLEKLIYEGTKLGLEKYQTFFDILWFDELPFYNRMSLGEVKKVEICLVADKWIVDGKTIKQYRNAKRLSENLWQIEEIFPTWKQVRRMRNGYNYLDPHKIVKVGAV